MPTSIINTHPVHFVPTVLHSGWRAGWCVWKEVRSIVCAIARSREVTFWRLVQNLEGFCLVFCAPRRTWMSPRR